MRVSSFFAAFVLLLTIAVRACLAAEWIPELESAEINRESGLDFAWSQGADSTRRTVLLNKLIEQARSLYAQKKYSEAMGRAKYANRVEKTTQANEVIAECLAHIGRPVEALAELRKLPYSSWGTRVEVYETLGMYKEALKACALPDANFEPYVFKCNLLMKHGERAQAIELARTTYFRFTCYGREAPRQLAEFFSTNGLPLPQPVIEPEAQTEIINLIKRLPQIHEPKSQKNLSELFARKFAIAGTGPLGPTYSSDERAGAPICQIYLRNPEVSTGRTERTLSFEVNQGTSDFKQTDVERILRDVGAPNISESVGLGSEQPATVEKTLDYSLPDAHLRFNFTGPNKRLLSIVKAWTDPTASAAAAKIATPSQSPAINIDAIKKEIASFNYKKAARNLMINWDAGCAGSEPLRVEQRKMLVQCFQLLKKPEVADYIKAAAWRHINNSIVHADYDPDKLDLTLDTYMHRLWQVRGPAEKDKGNYTIQIPNVEMTTAYQSENPALYAKLFTLVGSLDDQQQKEIAPLPAELIDQMDFRTVPNDLR